jgi:ThiF family
MSLASFIERAAAAATPLFADAGHDAFLDRLRETSVTITIDPVRAADPGRVHGYLFAVNLAARLYPTLRLDAPPELAARATALANSINPEIELATSSADGPRLVFGPPAHGDISVDACAWDAAIDRGLDDRPASGPAGLAAGAHGISEVFRAVFADWLGDAGRGGIQPGGFNLVSLGADAIPDLPVPSVVDLGAIHVAGVGAIGQAALLALDAASASGTIYAVDHERTEPSNAQRYVLMGVGDVGKLKPKLAKKRLADSALTIVPVCARWGTDPRAQLDVDTVLVALDSLPDRIAIQAGLPRLVYNAWTQPGDLGWSRHERFGVDPCLACICWPRGRRLDEHELIAQALNQHPLRVSVYLATRCPVGQPLAPGQAQGTLRHPLPTEADTWTERSLLDDLLATRTPAPGTDPASWRERTVRELYREGICGGMLIRAGGDVERELTVPLAHQSALAGLMLGTELVIARTPELAEVRSSAFEAGFDVTTGGFRILERPVARREGCICEDDDFRHAYTEQWGSDAS